jgi:hypothetical protein
MQRLRRSKGIPLGHSCTAGYFIQQSAKQNSKSQVSKNLQEYDCFCCNKDERMSKVYEALFLSWVLSAPYLFVGFFGSSS